MADALPYFRLPYFEALFAVRAAAAKWLLDYVTKTKEMPKLAILKRHNPSVDTLIRPPPLAYIMDVLREGYTQTIMIDTSPKMTDAADKKDMPKFLSLVTAMSDAIRAVTSPIESASTEAATVVQDTIAQIDKDPAMAMKFMPTGFKGLDDTDAGGLRPGHIYVLASLVSLGKTYVSLQMAENIRKQGFKVLYMSLEMPTEDLKRRTMALRYRLNADEVVRRKAPASNTDPLDIWYKKLMLHIEQLAAADTCKGSVIVKGDDAGIITTAMIAADIREHRPDVVIIDAAQDLRDSKGTKERTPALYNALAEINGMVKTEKVAILMTVQLDPEVERKGLQKANLTRIAWGQAFAQKAHIAFTMLGDRTTQVREIKVEKGRDGDAGRTFWLKFHFPTAYIEATCQAPGNLAEIDAATAVAETVSELDAAIAAATSGAMPDPPPATIAPPPSTPRRMPSMPARTTTIAPAVDPADTVDAPPTAPAPYSRDAPSPYAIRQMQKLQKRRKP
jgi:replicative DNA helicase